MNGQALRRVWFGWLALSCCGACTDHVGAAAASAPDESALRERATAPAPKAGAKAATAPVVTLFQNVRIFDGKRGVLSGTSSVMVRGNVIERVSRDALEVAPSARVTIIDGGGRTLMPGLIDTHWHMMMASVPMEVSLSADVGYLNLLAAQEAGDTLMRGFTSVRDMGGPVFGLKQAIDEGIVSGPRIYPSGAMISITPDTATSVSASRCRERSADRSPIWSSSAPA